MRAPSRTLRFWGLSWTLAENYIIEIPNRNEGGGLLITLAGTAAEPLLTEQGLTETIARGQT